MIQSLGFRSTKTSEDFLMGFLSDFLFGKKDGPFESYYKNGQLKEKGTYKDGEWDGPFEMYHENGQLWSKASLRQVEKLGGRPLHRLHLFRRPL